MWNLWPDSHIPSVFMLGVKVQYYADASSSDAETDEADDAPDGTELPTPSTAPVYVPYLSNLYTVFLCIASV